MNDIRRWITLCETVSMLGKDIQGALYHVAPPGKQSSIRAHGLVPQKGSFDGAEWNDARVFVTTHLLAACSLAIWLHDARGDDGWPYVIFTIDPSRIPDIAFHKDTDFTTYGLWTSSLIPAEAIIAARPIDPNIYHSSEYAEYQRSIYDSDEYQDYTNG